MSALLGLLLAAALPAAGAPARSAPPDGVDNAFFSCTAPAGWTVERRDNGAVFVGPAARKVAARIVVRFVPPGDAVRGDPKAYMRRLTAPSVVPLAGWKNGPVSAAPVGGRDALRVERDAVEYADAGSIAPKAVPVKEEHLAVPAGKGYYLLVYAAPRALDAELRPVFQALAASFKPKR